MYIRRSESTPNPKGYSAADERRILDVLGRGLLKEFPNPNRAGCPGVDVLRRIAFRQMPLSEAEKWLNHFGSCSPCYRDFSQLRQACQRGRRRTLLAIAAGVLLVAAVTGWTIVHGRNENPPLQTAVLDLRDRSPARGSEMNPPEPPLEVPRRVSHLQIYLPLGSSEGPYDVRVTTTEGQPLLAVTGKAKIQGGLTSMAVDWTVSPLSPGQYFLQVRKPNSEWASFPLLVR